MFTGSNIQISQGSLIKQKQDSFLKHKFNEQQQHHENSSTDSFERDEVKAINDPINMGLIIDLVEEMSKVKRDFDDKWEILLKYIRPEEQKYQKSQLIQINGEKYNTLKGKTEAILVQDYQKFIFSATVGDEKAKNIVQVEDRRDNILMDEGIQSISAPVSKFDMTRPGSSTTSTNLLIRDKLVSDLENAKALIKRDELQKRQLILKMRDMHQELLRLRHQLQSHNVSADHIVAPKNNGFSVDDNSPPFDNGQFSLLNDQLYEEHDESSEFVHFEAGQDVTTTVPTTNRNVNQQYATGGRENVEDSYVQPTQIREEMESSPIKQEVEVTSNGSLYSPGERCEEIMIDEEDEEESYCYNNELFSREGGEDITLREDIAGPQQPVRVDTTPSDDNYIEIKQRIGNIGKQQLQTKNQYDSCEGLQSEAKPKKPRQSPQNYQINKITLQSFTQTSPFTTFSATQQNSMIKNPFLLHPVTYQAPNTERHSRNISSAVTTQQQNNFQLFDQINIKAGRNGYRKTPSIINFQGIIKDSSSSAWIPNANKTKLSAAESFKPQLKYVTQHQIGANTNQQGVIDQVQAIKQKYLTGMNRSQIQTNVQSKWNANTIENNQQVNEKLKSPIKESKNLIKSPQSRKKLTQEKENTTHGHPSTTKKTQLSLSPDYHSIHPLNGFPSKPSATTIMSNTLLMKSPPKVPKFQKTIASSQKKLNNSSKKSMKTLQSLKHQQKNKAIASAVSQKELLQKTIQVLSQHTNMKVTNDSNTQSFINAPYTSRPQTSGNSYIFKKNGEISKVVQQTQLKLLPGSYL